MTTPRRSALGRVLRLYFWALLAALLLGLGIGFWIRQRMEQPRVQMGSAELYRGRSTHSGSGTPARRFSTRPRMKSRSESRFR